MQNPTVMEISFASILRTVLLVCGVLLLFVLRDILLLVFTAFILGSGLYLVGNFLEQTVRIPYKIGVIGTVLVVGGLVVALLAPLIPKLTSQLQDLQSELPQLIEQGEAYWQTFSSQSGEVTSLSSDNINSYTQKVASGLFFTTKNILGAVIYGLVLVVISVYLALEPRNLEQTISGFWPEETREHVKQRVREAREKVGNWIVGQIVIALILGVLSYLILWQLGVDNALLLGVLAGAFNMIPFIGPILAIIPAAIFGFLESVQVGVAVLIAYIILQQLEGNFLTPAIMNKVTGLSHVLIIISILIGGSLAGALGAVIAIPLVSVLSLFVEGLRPEPSEGVSPEHPSQE